MVSGSLPLFTPSTCLLAWLSTASGVRLSRCLSSLVSLARGASMWGGVVWLSACLSLRGFLHVSPTMASGVRLSGSHHFRVPSVSRFICLPTHVSSVFNHQSAVQWWCLILSVFLTICLRLHLSPHSVVSGGVLFLSFHHDFICDWFLSLFFSPFVSVYCLKTYTS